MERKITKLIAVTLLALFGWSNHLNAQAPALLKGGVANGDALVNEAIGNAFYFKFTLSQTHKQLWKTDGTSSGTQMVKDSLYLDIIGLVNINNTLYFISPASFSASAALALWKSNGTAAGTTVVKSFPGLSGVGLMTVIDNVCYFRLGSAIWKSDGTDLGTVEVKSGIIAGSLFYPVTNGIVFFAASAAPGYLSLWKTDGTSPGTVIVKDSVVRTTAGQTVGSQAVVDGSFYFWVANQNYLWKTDGTVSGTVQLVSVANVTSLTSHGGALYFASFSTSPLGWNFWKSDGTVSGTAAVPGLNNVKNIVSMGGALYLDGKTLYDSEPYKSDGTAAGTVLLKNIRQGATGSNPYYLTQVNNTVCFTADDSTYGRQIWKTNGTTGGTVMAYGAADTITSLSTVVLIPFNGYLLFVQAGGARDGLNSIYMDSTSAVEFGGTSLVSAKELVNIYPNPSSGVVRIQWGRHKNASLQVFNVLGEEVLQQSISQAVDFLNKPKGVYFVKVTANGRSHTRRLLLQK